MNEGLGLVKMMADYIYLLKYYDSLMGGGGGGSCCGNPHKNEDSTGNLLFNVRK